MNILKQLVGWVTALKYRFTHDIYFSTRLKIAVWLVFFVGVILVGFVLLVEYTKKVLMFGFAESLTLALQNGINDPAIIIESTIQTDTIMYMAILILLLFTLFCSINVSRLALAPIGQTFNTQKRFISGIAHELRTPLSILRMNNEIARFEMDPSSLAVALLDENISDIDMISDILNNLLLFDRMMSVESLRFEDVALQHIAQNVAGRLTSFATQKRITITVANESIPLIHGNKTAIEQVFFNILKNAVSYTPKGGEVRVTYAGQTDHAVMIRITDSGVGIPEKDLSHIFEPFYRSDKTGKLSGTGIGLAIVFEIMKLHKGSIEVESTEGKGTSFLLTFPTHTTRQDGGHRFPLSLFASHITEKR